MRQREGRNRNRNWREERNRNRKWRGQEESEREGSLKYDFNMCDFNMIFLCYYTLTNILKTKLITKFNQGMIFLKDWW